MGKKEERAERQIDFMYSPTNVNLWHWKEDKWGDLVALPLLDEKGKVYIKREAAPNTLKTFVQRNPQTLAFFSIVFLLAFIIAGSINGGALQPILEKLFFLSYSIFCAGFLYMLYSKRGAYYQDTGNENLSPDGKSPLLRIKLPSLKNSFSPSAQTFANYLNYRKNLGQEPGASAKKSKANQELAKLFAKDFYAMGENKSYSVLSIDLDWAIYSKVSEGAITAESIDKRAGELFKESRKNLVPVAQIAKYFNGPEKPKAIGRSSGVKGIAAKTHEILGDETAMPSDLGDFFTKLDKAFPGKAVTLAGLPALWEKLSPMDKTILVTFHRELSKAISIMNEGMGADGVERDSLALFEDSLNVCEREAKGIVKRVRGERLHRMEASNVFLRDKFGANNSLNIGND